MPSSESNWSKLIEQAPAGLLSGQLWCIVESQSQVATLDLVDTLQEQAVLEQMLETSKLPQPASAENLHYLLASPFRYPSLPWGSRFGNRHEPGIFYGAIEIETLLAETAFYRLLFWHGMSIPPPEDRLITQHDVFSLQYSCNPGLRLRQQPFKGCLRDITNPEDYRASQALGSEMRKFEIQGFEFPSARCPKSGSNIGMFSPRGLVSHRPENQQHWVCETASKMVRFRGDGKLLEFSQSLFLVSGKFPEPA